ncbi:MAG: class I SAM-dependent methyltransferase [Actinomycetota bacterium]
MSDANVRSDWSDEQVAEAVRANPLWYHTIELRRGIVTSGWFDLRPVVGSLPWPDVNGKRCLDIGTYDGFLAFELERRGASEVVATDVASHEDWDFPPAVRAGGVDLLRKIAGEKGQGFEVAARALGSSARKQLINVYNLSPSTVGTFDVVVCGSLLLHLRDPFRALEAIRSVCTGHFMSCEQIDVELSAFHRRTPLTNLDGIGQVQWHVPNVAGHRKEIRAAGFRIERAIRPYSIPFGAAHPPVEASRRLRLLSRLVTRGWGVPHSALLARPA